jgi:hypothetical protein
MATFAGLAPVRDDFRCSLCRQKNVFHCEHDTPYRDQLLGMYGQEKPHMTSANSRRQHHQRGSYNNNYNNLTNNYNMQHTNTERYRNSNTTAQYQQDGRHEKSSLSNTNTSYVTTNQQKKNKSCVIL